LFKKMRCAVLQLARNCEQYYKQDFPQLYNALQRALGREIEFYCVENDSTDNTVAAAQRYGHVLSLHRSSEPLALTLRCTMRTTRMAELRNQALRWLAQFGSFDYIFWLDTNVYFTVRTIQLLLQTLQQDKTIGLAGANTLQAGTCHYYDTYALNTPTCPWRQCTVCRGEHSMQDIIQVPSAFGGLCVTRPGYGTFAATHNQCEHVYMCTKLQEQDLRIVIVGPARATWMP